MGGKKPQDKWEDRNNWPASMFAQRVFLFLKNKDKGALLDLGCGSGRDSFYFARRGFKVTALDISENEYQLAKLKEWNIEFLKSDIQKAKIRQKSFGYIYAHLSLHYFNDIETTNIIDNLYQALKEGGYLFVKCKSINDPLFGKGRKIEDNFYEFNSAARHFFSKEYMKEKLESFKIINIKKTNSFSHPGRASFIEAIVQK